MNLSATVKWASVSVFVPFLPEQDERSTAPSFAPFLLTPDRKIVYIRAKDIISGISSGIHICGVGNMLGRNEKNDFCLYIDTRQVITEVCFKI